jgi:RNA polymerase sigma-70 factor (ECF subfamily)
MSGREDETALIEAVQSGDPIAYRGLVEKYQNRLHAMVYGMLRNHEDASDVTQQAFVKAYNNIQDFRLESKFYTWLYRIARNLAIDLLRKRKRQPQQEFDEAVATRTSEGTIANRHQSDSPSKALERKQLYAQIMSALDQLPADQKQVVLLRELEGFSYKEISDIMEIPEGTVMSRLYYARKRLQTLLGEIR